MKKLVEDAKETHAQNGAESMACYQLDLAIASDNSMFTKYGSVAAVENHNTGVINDVQNDYLGSFNHDLTFVIVTQFVVTGSDPWTNSLDAGALLASFRTWGNSGGFGVPFDLGELWTNRDFSSAELILRHSGLGRHVELCVSGTCVPRRKPHGDGMAPITERLKCVAQDITMVGDHDHDMMAARAVGSRAIRVSWNDHSAQEPCIHSEAQFYKVHDFSRWALGK